MNKLQYLLLPLCLTGLMACSSGKVNVTAAEAGLYNISIMYPAGKDKTFDMDYYEKSHMPMMASIIGKNLKFYEIDKGVSGRTPKDEAPYVAMCHFYCYDIEEYNKAIAQNRDTIIKDIQKYTNIQPVIQVSKVAQLSNSSK